MAGKKGTAVPWDVIVNLILLVGAIIIVLYLLMQAYSLPGGGAQ